MAQLAADMDDGIAVHMPRLGYGTRGFDWWAFLQFFLQRSNDDIAIWFVSIFPLFFIEVIVTLSGWGGFGRWKEFLNPDRYLVSSPAIILKKNNHALRVYTFPTVLQSRYVQLSPFISAACVKLSLFCGSETLASFYRRWVVSRYAIERVIRKCLTNRGIPTFIYYYRKGGRKTREEEPVDHVENDVPSTCEFF